MKLLYEYPEGGNNDPRVQNLCTFAGDAYNSFMSVKDLKGEDFSTGFNKKVDDVFRNAELYFKKIAENESGRELNDGNMMETDAGIVVKGIRTIKEMIPKLRSMSDPGMRSEDRKRLWDEFRRSFNQLTDIQTGDGYRSLKEVLNDAMKRMGYGKLGDSEVKFVCNLFQSFENVEQASEILSAQEELDIAAEEIERFHEERRDFMSMELNLEAEAKDRDVSLETLDTDIEQYEKQLKNYEADVRALPELKKRMEERTNEILPQYEEVVRQLNEYRTKMGDYSQELVEMRTGEFGYDNFMKNYEELVRGRKLLIEEKRNQIESYKTQLLEDELDTTRAEYSKGMITELDNDLKKLMSNKAFKNAVNEYNKNLADSRDMAQAYQNFETIDTEKLAGGMVFCSIYSKDPSKVPEVHVKNFVEPYNAFKETVIKACTDLGKKKEIEAAFQKLEHTPQGVTIADAFKEMKDKFETAIQQRFRDATAKLTELKMNFGEDLEKYDKIISEQEEHRKRANYTKTPAEKRVKMNESIKGLEGEIRDIDSSILKYCKDICRTAGLEEPDKVLDFGVLKDKIEDSIQKKEAEMTEYKASVDVGELEHQETMMQMVLDKNSPKAYKETEEVRHARVENTKKSLKNMRIVEANLGIVMERQNSLANRQKEIMSKRCFRTVPNENEIKDRLTYFGKRSNGGYDGKHTNTVHFDSLVNAVNTAKAAFSSNMSIADRNQALAALRDAANTYLEKKNSQVRPFPSDMRKARMQFAEEVKKYAESTLEHIGPKLNCLNGIDGIRGFKSGGMYFTPDMSKQEFIGKMREYTGQEEQQREIRNRVNIIKARRENPEHYANENVMGNAKDRIIDEPVIKNPLKNGPVMGGSF